MECFPPCKTCTGLCQAPVRKRPVRGVTPIPKKTGWTLLICDHLVPASEITLTVLGDKLGAQPFCDRCGDFRPVKKTRKKRAGNAAGQLELPPF